MGVKKIKVYTLSHETASPKCIGTMKAEDSESLANLRVRLEDKKVLEFQFQYWDPEESCRAAVSLESLNDIGDSVWMIPTIEDDVQDLARKRQRLGGDQDFIEYPADDEDAVPELTPSDTPAFNEISADLASCSRVSGSSEDTLLQSKTLADAVMVIYKEGEDKLRRSLKDVLLEDHEWGLKSYDRHDKAIVILHCLECRKDFGGTDGIHSKERISNLFSNFKKSHIMSNQHIRNWCLRKGLDWCNHPQSIPRGKKTVILTNEDHRRLVLEGVEILDAVNASMDPSQQTFQVIGGDPHTTQLKSFWWKAKCVTCNDFYSLCPPKRNLEANLRNHGGGSRHAEKVLEAANSARSVANSGKRGRLTKSVVDSSHSSQRQLHSFFGHVQDSTEVNQSNSMDRSSCKTFMCWGFRGPTVLYGGCRYEIDGLLFDIKPGLCWYAEPWLQDIVFVDRQCVKINGTFRHRSCSRVSMTTEPWDDLTCTICSSIPFQTNFRLRVMREDRSIEKRGTRTTEGGRRIGYLSLPELTTHSRSMSQKLRMERLHHWAAKVRIAQLRVKRPTLKESAATASTEHNLYKFCGDILSAHRSGAFGGNVASM